MNPKRITVHATASTFGKFVTISDLIREHQARGWRTIGYHRVICLDATVHAGRPLSQQGAHVYGFNKDNIGIALVGGLDRNGKPAFTFSEMMMDALFYEILALCERYNIPHTEVCGHRDYSPDLNGDGKITPNEFTKQCPCFDVRSWFKLKLEQYSMVTE